MVEDKLLLTIASLLDAVRAMQRGDDERAKAKLAQADKTLLQAAEQRNSERLVNLF